MSDMVLGVTGGQLAEKECVTSSKRTAEKGSGRRTAIATSEPALERPDTGPVASASATAAPGLHGSAHWPSIFFSPSLPPLLCAVSPHLCVCIRTIMLSKL